MLICESKNVKINDKMQTSHPRFCQLPLAGVTFCWSSGGVKTNTQQIHFFTSELTDKSSDRQWEQRGWFKHQQLLKEPLRAQHNIEEQSS